MPATRNSQTVPHSTARSSCSSIRYQSGALLPSHNIAPTHEAASRGNTREAVERGFTPPLVPERDTVDLNLVRLSPPADLHREVVLDAGTGAVESGCTAGLERDASHATQVER